MPAFSWRLTDDINRRLEQESQAKGRSRSDIARAALVEFLERRKRERFIAELVREARAAYSHPELKCEAVEIAEETIPSGNEALDLAEGRKPGEPWPEELGEKWWR